MYINKKPKQYLIDVQLPVIVSFPNSEYQFLLMCSKNLTQIYIYEFCTRS